MDKKSVLLGLFFLIGGFVLLMYNSAQQQEAQRERLERQREAARLLQQEAEELDRTDPEIVSAAPVQRPRVAPDLVRPAGAEALPEAPVREEQFYTLSNEHVTVRFSSLGGAVQSVTLNNYPAELDGDEPVVLNGGTIPALAISRAVNGEMVPFAPSFTADSITDSSITFSVTLGSGIVLRRTFELSTDAGAGPEPYTIRHRTEFYNPTDTAFNVDRIFLHIGTAAPTNADPMGFDLNASFLSRGKYRSIPASRFREGGFFFRREAQERVERRTEVTWGAVKNQFFTSILTPATPAEAIVATGVRFPPELGSRNRDPVGVSAALEFALPTLAPGESRFYQW
ncbi:MAG: YidC/Oxa1 family insertase periplasmic-domain containing protein [Verrucomicrobia bacterium]|nr:YidC/Oxa1 family insertase periplasmic-domain containing protein [Verrucomicrobiota bacterium]